MDRPFLGTEALGAGTVTRRTLANRYEAVYRNVYLPKGSTLTAATRAEAAWLWSGRQGVLAGLSAAAAYGSRWIDADEPAELFRRNGKPVDGILIHRDELAEDETRLVAGVVATSPERTAFILAAAAAEFGPSFGWTRLPRRREYGRSTFIRSSSGIQVCEGSSSCAKCST